MPSRSSYYDPTTAAYYNPQKDRRIAIVTGGHAGLGYYTTLHLYLHGYIVYLAGRTESKVLKAIEDLKAEAKKRLEAYSDADKKERFLGGLSYLHFDSCDLGSVAACAENFKLKESKLNVLINNAGIMAVPYEETQNGYEIQYQVNFVAPFLFTLKLLPSLQAAQADGAPRSVVLLSTGHRTAYKYYDPSDKINYSPSFLYTWVRYGAAKTADIHYTKKLAELHPEILSFAIHPGVIVDTELFTPWKNTPGIGWLYRGSSVAIKKTVGVSIEEGSLATLRAALDPALNKNNGAYLETGGSITSPSSAATNKKNIDRTWDYNIDQLRKKGFLKSTDI